MNYDFELEKWLPRFPPREVHGHYSGADITSPCDLCNNEWLRRGMADEYDWGSPVAVDLFVMSRGEPADRYVTKIGGLPYRSADASWPVSASGTLLQFIAQFNFLDSLDIVGELPGDLLLVFGDYTEIENSALHFEWQQIGIRNAVSESQMPHFSRTILPCFGNRCRCLSYPQASRKSRSKNPQCQGKDVWHDNWIPQYQGTQIGSSPFFMQDMLIAPPHRCICTIASVQPDPHQLFPWVNVPDPLYPPDEWPFQTEELMLGDLGCIYILIDDKGRLEPVFACY